MKGFYVHITQDGITILRWFRTRDKAAEFWNDIHKNTGREATFLGDSEIAPTPNTQ